MDRELAAYVMVEDPQQCVALVAEAREVEKQAMQDDRDGRSLEAAEGYRQVASKIREAVDFCPEGHPDKQVLLRHVDQVLQRADYLEGLAGIPKELITPLEEHVQGVQLTLGIPSAMQDVSPSSKRKVMGTAAVISGAAGLLMLGPLSGAVLAVATAHATTRKDFTGSASRMMGQAGVKLVDQATTFEKEHKICQCVAQNASDKAWAAIGNLSQKACDKAQTAISNPPQQCVAFAAEACEVEKQAMQDDRDGRSLEAAQGYRQVASKIREAVDFCPEGHPDKQVLLRHVDQVLQRADYLESLDGIPKENITPLEEHIEGVPLTLGIPSAMQEVSPSSERKVMGTAAVISGAAGLLMLGPVSGAVLGVATAHATTREDWTGSASRMVGQVGVKLVDQAKEHKITQNASDKAQTAISNFDERHGVTEKARQAQTAISNFDERHGVTEKARRGLALMMRALLDAIQKAKTAEEAPKEEAKLAEEAPKEEPKPAEDLKRNFRDVMSEMRDKQKSKEKAKPAEEAPKEEAKPAEEASKEEAKPAGEALKKQAKPAAEAPKRRVVTMDDVVLELKEKLKRKKESGSLKDE